MESRTLAIDLFHKALEAADPKRCVERYMQRDGEQLQVGLKQYDLASFQRIFVLGSGKGSLKMAEAALEILGERVSGGVVISNKPGSLPPLETIQGSHPIPDENSLRAAQSMLSCLEEMREDDLFIYLLSGGNSALCELPQPPLTLEEYQQTTRTLLGSGAEIQELNTLRKHLSQVKGGRLAQHTRATGVALVLSDVIGDDFSSIGSGPFYPDSTTFADCQAIIDRYGIASKLPENALDILNQGAAGAIEETPKQTRDNLHHQLIGSNALVLGVLKRELENQGIRCVLQEEPIRGEARDVARDLLEKACHDSGTLPCVYLFGGEPIVTLKGKGMGGRNHEMALSALEWIGSREDVLFLSGGTDGIDGMTDSAGAIADSLSFNKANEAGLSIAKLLDNNDSGSFFKTIGEQITTGPTGTNVMDIVIIVRR